MRQLLSAATMAILLWAFAACKKDLLHVQRATQLATHTSSRLNNIRFITDSLVYIGGGEVFSEAVVLKSTDAGYTWSASSYPQAGKELFGFGVSPFGSMYFCGVDGTVLHTADTGKTWDVDHISDWLYYVGAAYPSKDTGIFISRIQQRGGNITQVDANFNDIDKKTFLFGLNNIYMLSAATGYVAGYGAVLKTTDYRRTWQFQNVSGDDFTAMDIHGDEIWMCGANGGIFHTTDAGAHWQTLRNGNDITLKRYYLRCILFADSQYGWAAGEDGIVLHTDDGGRHWMEYDKFTTNCIRTMALCRDGALLAAGDNGALYRITP